MVIRKKQPITQRGSRRRQDQSIKNEIKERTEVERRIRTGHNNGYGMYQLRNKDTKGNREIDHDQSLHGK